MQYIVAVCNSGKQVLGTVGKKTRSQRKAYKVADTVRPHIKDDREVLVLSLDSYTRASISMFGTWDGMG